jgi:hypothetical protein
LRFLKTMVVALLSLALLAACGVVSQSSAPGPSSESANLVKVLQIPGEPHADIAPLPPEVSNGTSWFLDGTDSYVAEGSPNWTWEIQTPNSTEYFYLAGKSYVFRTLGLYTITLTVTDNNGTSDEAFTAVYSILDSDSDGLPDWWEMWYFVSLDESGADDYDTDGWTNLQEFANDLDPTEEDARPGLIHELAENWVYIVAIIVAAVVLFIALQPMMRKRRKSEEKKKIDAAIEIERVLQEK